MRILFNVKSCADIKVNYYVENDSKKNQDEINCDVADLFAKLTFQLRNGTRLS